MLQLEGGGSWPPRAHTSWVVFFYRRRLLMVPSAFVVRWRTLSPSAVSATGPSARWHAIVARHICILFFPVYLLFLASRAFLFIYLFSVESSSLLRRRGFAFWAMLESVQITSGCPSDAGRGLWGTRKTRNGPLSRKCASSTSCCVHYASQPIYARILGGVYWTRGQQRVSVRRSTRMKVSMRKWGAFQGSV